MSSPRPTPSNSSQVSYATDEAPPAPQEDRRELSGDAYWSDPENLYMEVVNAIEFRQLFTIMAAERVKRIAGNAFRSDWKVNGDLFHPHEFEYMVNFAPKLSMFNPTVRMENNLPGVPQMEMVVDGLETYINQWIPSVDLVGTLDMNVIDLMTGPSVGVLGVERVPGYEINSANGKPVPMRPSYTHLAPWRYFKDPLCVDHRKPRFQGHEVIVDKATLKAMKGVNQEVLERLPKDDEQSEVKSNDQLDRDFWKNNLSRNEVRYYEVYVHATRMVHCVTCVIQRDGRKIPMVLLPPRKWKATKRGPYVEFGVYILPGQVYPLPPLAITDEKVRELNAHRGQQSDDAGAAKQFVAYDSNDKETGQAMLNAANGTMIGIPGLATKVQNIKIGGANPENIAYIEQLNAELDRVSGISDVLRGHITNATATEVEKNQANADIRVRYMQEKFRRSVKQIIEGATEIAFNEKSVVAKVRYLDPASGQETSAVFMGGMLPDQQGLTADDVLCNIEPMSMELVSDVTLQQRIMQAGQLTIQVAQTQMQMPFFKGREYLDDALEALNIPNGADKYIDWGMLRKMMAMQMMMQAQAAQTGQAQAQADIDKSKADGVGAKATAANGKNQGQGGEGDDEDGAALAHVAQSHAAPQRKAA